MANFGIGPLVSPLPGLKGASSVASARRILAQAFRDAGLDSPDLDARLLIAHALRLEHAALAASGDRPLEPREIDAISARAQRRLMHEPVARILGGKEFWSLWLRIDSSVLVPRPETETIVETALAAAPSLRSRPSRILDIGVGSGAILLALLSELPDAFGVGTDISTGALAIARENGERHDLDKRTAFLACNLAAALRGPFDLIVSNPPYIAGAEIDTLAPEVRDYDPRQALDGGNDGLDFYRAIAQDAPRLLAPDGVVVVELGIGQQRPVTALFAAAGLIAESPVKRDLLDIPRALCVRRAT